MDHRIYGYARVSTREQNEDRQVIAMRAFGVDPRDIVVEKQSGRNFDRPVYRKLVRRLREGDVLVLKSIDRLGRNYNEILEQWRFITKEKKADIVVLDMPLLDTRGPDSGGRDLTGTLIADIVLELLSYVAETEREFIRQRQREGIAAAKEKGVHFGRRPYERPECWQQVAEDWREKKITAREGARSLGVSISCFYTWMSSSGPGGGCVSRENPDYGRENPNY